MRRRRHSHRRGKNHTVRNIVIGCFVITLFLATGYSAFQTNITLKVKGNVKEKSRIIKARDETAFWQESIRTNIVSITFLDSANIPNNVVDSWDVSADRKGGVIAYITINNNDYSKYDLFIGAKDGVIANTSCYAMFSSFTNVMSINFNNNFDTFSVTSMVLMFNNCNNLISLNLSGIRTDNVTNMHGMFCNCSKLKSLNLSMFNTSNVTIMRDMFLHCHELEELNLNNFNTSKVISMQGMFAVCNKLSKLNIDNFNTTNVTNMYEMFLGCNLEELDLSSFNTQSVTDIREMFKGCTNLKTIYTSDSFVTTAVINSSSMFASCTNLIGGNGTVFDLNHIDKEYARIDVAGTSGYFTLKQ